MKPVLFGEQDAVRELVYGNEGMKVIGTVGPAPAGQGSSCNTDKTRKHACG